MKWMLKSMVLFCRPSTHLDIVGTVYHLVIYMQSNKIHNVVLVSKFYSALFVSSTCFGPHRSVIRSVLYKLCSQTLVCGNTRTARHVQPLQSSRKIILESVSTVKCKSYICLYDPLQIYKLLRNNFYKYVNHKCPIV